MDLIRRSGLSLGGGIRFFGVFFGAFLLTVFLSGVQAEASDTRPTHPNVVGVELLGRGLAYSLTYDRMLDPQLAAGFGYGVAGLRIPSTQIDWAESAQFLPVYVNYYFKQDQNSLYATGGFTLLLNSGSVAGAESKLGKVGLRDGVLMNAGLGFESRNDAGYLFRFAGYLILSDSKVNPWLGAQFGYAF